jgi:hypothetical protein
MACAITSRAHFRKKACSGVASADWSSSSASTKWNFPPLFWARSRSYSSERK